MARLFSKDYHERSASWYFNHAVIALDKGDLQYWKSIDEAGCFHIHFVPNPDRREFFSPQLDVVYDPATQTVKSHHCHECRDAESCRHFLSVLRYAYLYLRTDIFDLPAVETCDGTALRSNERWQLIHEQAAIEIEGIYNPETDKIRFYHGSYEPLDIPLLLKIQGGTPPEGMNKARLEQCARMLEVFSDLELALFKFLNSNKAAYSAKTKFWSIYKKDFAAALGLMQNMEGRLKVRETGETLVFVAQPYPLSLRVEPAGKNNFRVMPVIVEELSAVYPGFPTWLFFRAQVQPAFIPLGNEALAKLFDQDLLISAKDLVYWRTIVHQELHKHDIYLDFDPAIDLPRIISTRPRIMLRVEPLGDNLVLEGKLAYPSPVASEEGLKLTLPLSVVRFQAPLIRGDYESGGETGNAWFHLPPEVFTQVERLLKLLPEADLSRLEQFSQLVFSGQDALARLRKALFELEDEAWDIEIAPELRGEFIQKVALQVEIQARRSEDIDWFSYEISYRHKDLSFTHEELGRFFRSNEDFLQTRDGRILYISNPEVFKETERLLQKSEALADNVYRARLVNLPYYQRYMRENPSFRLLGDEWMRELATDLMRGHLERTEALPAYLNTVLRGYQKSGYAWMKMLQHYRLGGILADEMGLGKTIQALAVILNSAPDSQSLVVCPKTLLYNWAAEIEKFHANIPCQIVEGNKETRLELLANPNVKLFIISYTVVLNDIAVLKEKSFEWMVLDEAQNIKNVSAKRTYAIKKIPARNRLALTGTPVENNLTELWSIYDFLMPGYLGNLKRFKNDYLEDPESGAAKLKRAVAPFLLRRVKKEVLLELPDKQEQVSWCKMHPVQEKLYLQIIDMVQKKLLNTPEAANLSFVHVLAALTKLRQVCNHPHLANPDILPEIEASAKLEQLVELVRDAMDSGHKILVFSQFVQMLRIIRRVFDALGLGYAYMDGHSKNRMEEVRRFETDPELKLFLISLKTGGTGLNLTSADTVILYDPWWNPMVENQAIDRTHRIGQTRKVQVFRLITKGSVEEKILNLQQHKLQLFDEVVSDSQTVLSTLSREEINDLFSY
ncbi:MAG: DEAD/DEAH box helicase [Candidatus Syntrophosphaera sp.]|nr:DEAD/DEAH box helicase [Candidatus Syntrophosphaera sp.]